MKKNKKHHEFIPEFDSSSSMLFSLGNYLFGRDEAVGLPPKLPSLLGDVINLTPLALRKSGYRVGGVSEAVSTRFLKKVTDEDISKWIIDAYPRRKYPAVVIGSANGALIHLCSMLGVPWIPQTVLVAVKRTMDPDEIIKDMEWGKKPAEVLKKRLPGFRLHQMHDPIQDRIMITNMGYFRIKRLKLGGHLEKYIEDTLLPGGTVIISDCDYTWPAHKVDNLHYFQTGGLGDVSGKEYAEGSTRVKKFLEKEGSERKKWDVPSPLEDVPEAEWGYDKSLDADIKELAREKGYKVRRIRYRHPDIMGPLAADMTRQWYKNNGIDDERYLVECFALLEPLLAARTGSIPFWMAFNTQTSFDMLRRYMGQKTGVKELYVMIMSNAVEGIGLVPLKDWKKFMKNTAAKSDFLGIDGDLYPFDLGSFIKYYKDLRKKIKTRYFLPYRMCLEEFTEMLKKKGEKYEVEFKQVYLK
ncbi:MAG: hypothetical protein GF409_07510 [Candidatus Omnitrophica bacterium]|nr:hypothetical protein [Candidatus Omnitrophota bacterium]